MCIQLTTDSSPLYNTVEISFVFATKLSLIIMPQDTCISPNCPFSLSLSTVLYFHPLLYSLNHTYTQNLILLNDYILVNGIFTYLHFSIFFFSSSVGSQSVQNITKFICEHRTQSLNIYDFYVT